MFGAPQLATDWSALSYLPKKYQRKYFRGYVGQFGHSIVRKSTTKHYFPTRWRSPSLETVCTPFPKSLDQPWRTRTLANKVADFTPCDFFVWGKMNPWPIEPKSKTLIVRLARRRIDVTSFVVPPGCSLLIFTHKFNFSPKLLEAGNLRAQP